MAKEYLNKEEAEWLREFAAAFAGDVVGSGHVFTPNMLNQTLIRKTNNPRIPDYDKLVKALNEAVIQADTLEGYQEWMEMAEMTFKRILEYYSTMLSFDLSYTCININNKADYQSSKYKRDKKIVEDFLTNFNYKKEFQQVVKQMMRSETVFMWLRNNENAKHPKFSLQMLPQKYCLTTGATNETLLMDFDMTYFLQPSVDINGYDPVFKEFFTEAYKDTDIKNYKPTNSLNNRTGTFAYWVQTSPIYINEVGLPSGAWVFKRDMSTFNNVPYLSAMMRDAILNIPVKKLQYDKDAASAYAYLVGEIGMLKATEANATQFDPIRLGTLLNIVKQAVGKNIAVGAMPANEVKWHQFVDQNETMADTQVKSTMATGAGASRILYASDKMSQEEIRNAILADYNVMKILYEQFNTFLDFYVNQLTKKYKFKFAFDGSNYGFEREWRKDGLMRMAENGIVLNDTAFASAYGYHPVMFSKMLQETSADGSWMENLSSLQSIFTASANPGDGSGDSYTSQKGGNRSNYNVPGGQYIHTGKPGRPRKADTSTDSSDYDNSNE